MSNGTVNPQPSIKKKLFLFLLSKYKQFKLNRIDLSPENSQTAIRALLKKARYLFVITQSSNETQSLLPTSLTGSNARYIQPIVEWEGEIFRIWTGTSASSRKVREIENNPGVTLAVGNESAGANLIIHGYASLHDDIDLKLRYWEPEWRLFFPGGPRDKDYIVICVEPQRLELMDLKRNVTPEPFGLKPLQLVRNDSGWQPQTEL